MPPRTKSKVSKPLKENLVAESKSSLRNKISKPARKVLADKTNSLSDNSNTNNEVIKKRNKVATKVTVVENNGRPQRVRRMPTRYAENQGLLNNLLNKKDTSIPESPTVRQNNISDKNKIVTKQKTKNKELKQSSQLAKKKSCLQVSDTPNNDTLLQCYKSTCSPIKTPINEDSCVFNRPKRIHRLPSRFDENSMTPSKFLSIHPTFASTPLQQKDPKKSINESRTNTKTCNSSNKSSPDTNNNPKKIRAAKQKVNFKNFFSPPQVTLKPKRSVSKVAGVNRKLNKSQSFKVLENKQNKGNHNVADVYEFTYDPDEEPTPKKKKKKRVVKKNPPKPKFVIFKNNYEQNLSRTLNNLKGIITKKLTSTSVNKKTQLPEANNKLKEIPNDKEAQSNKKLPVNTVVRQNDDHINLDAPSKVEYNKPKANIITNQQPMPRTESQKRNDIVPKSNVVKTKTLGHENNFVSIRIEDIAADFETSDNYDDLNYSPVNSPVRPVTPNNNQVVENANYHSELRSEIIETAVKNHDPLNLQDNISFFKEQPAASSSMNMSVKHPLASPWRVEFENLPIKWQVNTYVKPNMTPAVESSFISSKDDNKKKHVYTNMLVQSNDIPTAEGIENNTSHLKQTSIISFMKEVAEKSANKKKRALSVTPTKANSLFEDTTNISLIKNKNSPQKIVQKDANIIMQNKKSYDKENVRDNRKRKNEDKGEKVPAKSPCRQKDKDFSYFGFDDSENQDIENISPKKIDQQVRSLRPRARAVLHEINGQIRPTRADLPLAVKSKTITSSEAVDKMYENLKSAEVAPSFENGHCIQKRSNTINVDAMSDENIDNADSNSVHLFEDLELVHHLKPTRKSYGKPKRVAFRQQSGSDDDDDNQEDSDKACHSVLSDVDDMGDLTFTMPEISKKKPTRKKKTKSQLSNKEKKEADAWAAGFNSMCEDIEEFPLLVE